jgi:(R,R)-butanediol dehydrogenase/meso-butanediol dehydrogenase/diacetyl reductase
MSMRAAVIGPDGAFEVASVPEPSPGPGELLLRVTGCGLCGSDIKARAAMPPGTIMGHEFSGEVVGAGPGVADSLVGRHAAVLPVGACGKCSWCEAGYVIHCPQARLIGLGGVGGGFAELAVVPAGSSFLLPPDVDPLYGPVVEPFSVGLHVNRAAEVSPGDDVLVIGLGAVGLTTIAWARARGAGRITAVDPVGSRRDAALPFGATDVLPSLSDAGPGTYDVVAECAGKAELIDGCVTATRPRGRVVVASTCLDPASLTLITALMKEVTITFAVYYTPAEFEEVVAAFSSGLISPAPLVSRRLGLDDLNNAFQDLVATSAGAKTLIQP